MLSVEAFPDSHTAVNIAAKMEDLFGFWGFEGDKIFMVVRDNAANMKAAFQDAGFDSFGCLAHSFQVRTTGASISNGKK